MEQNNDIFWHALNYRTAATQHAEQMWQELAACVNRLIAEEREACANVCDKIAGSDLHGQAGEAADAIRMRSNVKVEGLT